MTNHHDPDSVKRRIKEAADKAPQPPEAPPRHEGKIRVLLVEDHTVVRQIMADRLSEEQDIELVGLAASEGHIAVEVARRQKPDVIVMDLNLPGMNGLEATRRIKTEMPEVKVIGLSVDTDPETSRQMINAGASTHLSKTATLEELLHTIRQCAHEAPAQKNG